MDTQRDRGATTQRPVTRHPVGGPALKDTDALAVEEPLEIRVASETLVVTMRSPGHDRELTLGFLFTEGIIGSCADVGTVAHCGRPDDAGYGNTIDVTPGPGTALDPELLEAARRDTLTSSACGVCGRRSIDDLIARCGVLDPGPVLPLSRLREAPPALRQHQPVFRSTGAVHGAMASAENGECLAAFEDVGRHNAVDKVLGRLLLDGRIGTAVGKRTAQSPALLTVSGRISFEIVQKAAAAEIPILAGVSAPTSLAVDLARRVHMTLAGFVRDDQLNLYTHPERITDRS